MNVQKLLVGTMALVLIASLANTQAFAAPTGSGEDIAAPAAITPQVVEALDCDVDSGDIVAFETSRGQDADAHSTAVADLEANGFVVKEFNIDTDDIPECIVKMVITSTQGSDACIIGNDYSSDQIDDIAEWVENGGALLILNEWGSGSDCGDLTDEVSEAFGETPGSVLFSQTYLAGTNYDADNPETLFDGVDSWEVFASNNYAASADAVTTDGAFPDGNPTAIAKEVGNGCVLMTGDANWMRDGSIASADNQALALNAFEYLNECIVVVGGEFLPIDSTALFLAGLSSSAVWIIPTLAGLAGAGVIIRSRLHRD